MILYYIMRCTAPPNLLWRSPSSSDAPRKEFECNANPISYDEPNIIGYHLPTMRYVVIVDEYTYLIYIDYSSLLYTHDTPRVKFMCNASPNCYDVHDNMRYH